MIKYVLCYTDLKEILHVLQGLGWGFDRIMVCFLWFVFSMEQKFVSRSHWIKIWVCGVVLNFRSIIELLCWLGLCSTIPSYALLLVLVTCICMGRTTSVLRDSYFWSLILLFGKGLRTLFRSPTNIWGFSIYRRKLIHQVLFSSPRNMWGFRFNCLVRSFLPTLSL